MPEARQLESDVASDPAVWVDRHGDALYRYALLRVRDPGAAEEVVQECFAAALVARERFAGQSSERTWLIGILKRKVIDHFRRRAREAQHSGTGEQDLEACAEGVFFAAGGKWKGRVARWGGDPRNHLENRDFWDVFQNCLGRLPASLADAFVLREVDQVSAEEVCKVLDVSATNLWTRLHRARLGLRQCLETHWFGISKPGQGGE